jgi:OOP family OmpA-OmpF porin
MKRKLLFLLVALLASFMLCSPATAENRAGAGSVTPFIGGYNFDSDEDLDKSILYGFRVGYNFTKNWTLEGVLTYADANGDREYISIPQQGWVRGDSNDANMFGYKLEVLYNFLPDGMIVPFIAAGVGGRYMDWDDRGSENDLVLDYGVGLKIFFAEDWAVRADIRHLYLPDDSYNNVEYGIGLSYFFGGKKEKIAPHPPPPPPEPVPYVEPDTDRDGVIDKLDQCPDTPYGVKVDEVGCPLDTDKDGVYDYLDKCPNTPIELKVDKDGCPMKVTINLNVLFDFDKADIKPKFNSEIKRVADYMTAYPWEKATLEGHTDSKGTDAYNQKLSQRRVDAVMKNLVEKFGISADQLKAVGYGESKPIATNDTDEGRQLNRRVQAVMETYIRR